MCIRRRKRRGDEEEEEEVVMRATNTALIHALQTSEKYVAADLYTVT